MRFAASKRHVRGVSRAGGAPRARSGAIARAAQSEHRQQSASLQKRCVAFFSHSHCGGILYVNSAAHPAASSAHNALPAQGSKKKEEVGVEGKKRSVSTGLAVKRRRRTHRVSSGFGQRKHAQFIGAGMSGCVRKQEQDANGNMCVDGCAACIRTA